MFSSIEEVLIKIRSLDNISSADAFNSCFHFIETLMYLNLIEQHTGHKAKAILSWRNIQS